MIRLKSCLLYEWAVITETGALGAAILASLGCGEIKNMDEIAHQLARSQIFRSCNIAGRTEAGDCGNICARGRR